MLAGQTLKPDYELTLFIRDALRFIPAFIVPISQSAPKIYVSTLSFAPEQSLVVKKFRSRLPNTVVVTEGKPSHWSMVVFTAEHHKDSVLSMVFSPDESTFASISFGIMCVCDSETGHCISGPFKLSSGYTYSAFFSPDGKRILVKSNSHAVLLDIETGEEQFRIDGLDFVFTRHDGRIASTHWIDEDGKVIQRTFWGAPEDEGGDPTGIVIMLWDASNGALISNRLFEVNNVARTQFSPDGHFLAVASKSESVIELWNLEDGENPRRFSYPPGDLPSLDFSPTSDSLMAISCQRDIYLWRLDTQEMVSFSHDFPYDSHVIHSPLTNYLFIRRLYTVEIWDISVNDSILVWETNPPTTSHICSTRPLRDGHRLLAGCEDGSVRMWELDLESLAMNQADTVDTQDDSSTRQFIGFSRSGRVLTVLKCWIQLLGKS